MGGSVLGRALWVGVVGPVLDVCVVRGFSTHVLKKVFQNIFANGKFILKRILNRCGGAVCGVGGLFSSDFAGFAFIDRGARKW